MRAIIPLSLWEFFILASVVVRKLKLSVCESENTHEVSVTVSAVSRQVYGYFFLKFSTERGQGADLKPHYCGFWPVVYLLPGELSQLLTSDLNTAALP